MYIPGGCFLCFHKDCCVKFNELHQQPWPRGKTTADILRLLLSASSLGEHGWHSHEAQSSQSGPSRRDQTMRSSYTVFTISAWAGQVKVYNLYATYPKSVKCSGSVMSDSLRPRGLLCPRNSPGKSTGVGNRSLSGGSSRPRDQIWVSYMFLLLFSCWVVSDSLWPHELQHARLPCPSLSLWVCSNSCALSQADSLPSEPPGKLREF